MVGVFVKYLISSEQVARQTTRHTCTRYMHTVYCNFTSNTIERVIYMYIIYSSMYEANSKSFESKLTGFSIRKSVLLKNCVVCIIIADSVEVYYTIGSGFSLAS